MATEATVVIHDPKGRSAAYWKKVLTQVAEHFDAVIVEEEYDEDV